METIAPLDCAPEIGFPPVHALLAVQLTAFVVDQDRLTDWPPVIFTGPFELLARKSTVGALQRGTAKGWESDEIETEQLPRPRILDL